MSMTAELISVGTEILMGNIVNTNAAYLSRECAALGLAVYRQVTVGDNEERIMEAVRTALGRSDIVILTGGLGPTEDDLTKETTAKALGRTLVEDERTKGRIAEYFKGKDIPICENNWKQAIVIEGALVLDNDNGTAPGMIVEAKGEGGATKRAILLPGPPNEMAPMFEAKVAPYLKGLGSSILYSEMVKVCGIGESQAETMLLDLIDGQGNPTIAPYAKTGQVHFRITAKASTEEEAREIAAPVVGELLRRFGENVFTTREEETLEGCLVRLLSERGMRISTAESVTGGLIGATLVNVPGASEVFREGYVTYSNEAKRSLLGVREETLERYGAVSEETAREMAAGAARASGADVAVSVTGIAGPGGGTPKKPVGLVYVGCSVRGEVTARRFQFKGNRQKIRDNAVVAALDLARRCLAFGRAG